jgi:hypothetical protein
VEAITTIQKHHHPLVKEKEMAKKLFIAEEKWNTRFGKSSRVVVRDANGHFVDNKSKKQIRNGEELGYAVTR